MFRRGGESEEDDRDFGGGGGHIDSDRWADEMIREFDRIWDGVRGKIEFALKFSRGTGPGILSFLARVQNGGERNDVALAKIGRHVIGRILELQKK